MRGLMSISATRSPLIDTSSCSPRVVLPNSCPLDDCSIARKLYSPSAGNTCTTDNAAARAERCAFDVAILRRRARDAVSRFGWRRRAIAERQRADAARGAQIALHQRRGRGLHVGDVVEAVAARVGRQKRGDVDIEADQVVDRPSILGAIQALKRTPARDWDEPPTPDPSAARARSPGPSASPRPDASRRAAASCRRAACESSSRRRQECPPPWPGRTPPATGRRTCRGRCDTTRSSGPPARSIPRLRVGWRRRGSGASAGVTDAGAA